MKNARIFTILALTFGLCSSVASGVDIQGDYILVTAMSIDGEVEPHNLGAIAARITKRGEDFQIAVADITGTEPAIVPLYIDGSKVSFFLPPREFIRDGRRLMSNAEAYFGVIVANLYIAGKSTYGERMESFKLKRVEPIPEVDSD